MEELGEKAMLLRDALGVTRGEMVSLIGAGGKTTTMFRLAKELRDQGCKVLVTTTTKIVKPTKPHIDRLFLVDEVQALIDVCADIAAPAIIGAGCGVNQEGELLGMPVAMARSVKPRRRIRRDLGRSRWRGVALIKNPGERRTGDTGELPNHRMDRRDQNTRQTALPTHGCIGSARARDLLGLPADAQGQRRNPSTVAPTSKTAASKVFRPASRKIALINQADSPAEMAAAQALGDKTAKARISTRVVITSYASAEPIIHRMAH